MWEHDDSGGDETVDRYLNSSSTTSPSSSSLLLADPNENSLDLLVKSDTPIEINQDQPIVLVIVTDNE